MAIIIFWFNNSLGFHKFIGKINFDVVNADKGKSDPIEELCEAEETEEPVDEVDSSSKNYISALICKHLDDTVLSNLPKILLIPGADVFYAVLLMCNALQP